MNFGFDSNYFSSKLICKCGQESEWLASPFFLTLYSMTSSPSLLPSILRHRVKILVVSDLKKMNLRLKHNIATFDVDIPENATLGKTGFS